MQAGLNVGLQLLWVDYTSTEGVFPPGGQPPNFQAVRTTLQVFFLSNQPFPAVPPPQCIVIYLPPVSTC
jgi:hypothetical protein